jgi:hypothetical protein
LAKNMLIQHKRTSIFGKMSVLAKSRKIRAFVCFSTSFKRVFTHKMGQNFDPGPIFDISGTGFYRFLTCPDAILAIWPNDKCH